MDKGMQSVICARKMQQIRDTDIFSMILMGENN